MIPDNGMPENGGAAQRSGQFFIIATVLISGALLFIVVMLTATADLSYTEAMSRHDTGLMTNIANQVQDMWWDTRWQYRTGVTVEEQGAVFLPYEPVSIVLPAKRGQVRDDCSDIRVIQNGREMPWNATTGCDIDTYQSETDAAARYPFDEGTGQWANDSTGNGYHGRLQGNPVWAGGRYGHSLRFNGAGDHVRVQDNDTMLDIQSTDWTIMAWINKERTEQEGIVSKPGSFWFYVDDDGRLHIEQGYSPWNSTYSTPGTITTGAWHHVAATYNGTHASLYVDGTEQAEDLITFQNASNNLYLGTWNGALRNWTGRIDDVRLYPHTLRDDQIEGIYQNGIGLNISVTLDPLETTDNLFIYHGNPFALPPDYPEMTEPTPVPNRPSVTDVGVPRERDEMHHNLKRNVEQLDEAVSPTINYRESRNGCSLIELRSTFAVLAREACIPPQQSGSPLPFLD